MADLTTMRLNSEDRPDRAEKFTAMIAKYQLNQAGVVRGLVDALLKHVEEHGGPPAFPVTLTEAAPTAARRSTKKNG